MQRFLPFLFFLCLIENSLFPIKPFISWMKFARSFLQFSKTIHHFAVSALTTSQLNTSLFSSGVNLDLITQKCLYLISQKCLDLTTQKCLDLITQKKFRLDYLKMFDIFYIQLDHPLSLCYSFVLVYISTINQLLASIWTLNFLSGSAILQTWFIARISN